MLGNERDGLMQAERPDWWDIGHVSGPRAYLTRAHHPRPRRLRVRHPRARPHDPLSRAMPASARMRRALFEASGTTRPGISSMASTRPPSTVTTTPVPCSPRVFGLLDPVPSAISSSERRVESCSIRPWASATRCRWTTTFEGRVSVSIRRSRTPGVYMNGGVWPQGNAWYALALIAAGRGGRRPRRADALPERGRGAGQPKRTARILRIPQRRLFVGEEAFGEVDKPTFLWAGGGGFSTCSTSWRGVRETPWNVLFSPVLP